MIYGCYSTKRLTSSRVYPTLSLSFSYTRQRLSFIAELATEIKEMKTVNLDLPKYDHLVLVAEGIIGVYEYLTIQAQYDLAHDTIQHELSRKRYREIEPYKFKY